MRHIHTFQKFALNESIKLDLKDHHELNSEEKTLIVNYDPDDWEDYYSCKRAIQRLAANQNDPMSEEIDDALYAYGFGIDYDKEHDYDHNVDSAWVEFQLKEIPHAELASNPIGIKALQRKGYTEEEIESLKIASDYGIIS
jgi:pyruvate formate-lyase activating enzyme-like uncharacterized protein